MYRRLFLFYFCIVFFLMACSDNTEPSTIAEEATENEQGDEQKEIEESPNDQDNKKMAADHIAEDPVGDVISPNITISGKMTLKEDIIEVDAESNLPEGVQVRVKSFLNPYGGNVVSEILENETIEVGQSGVIKGSIPFDSALYESNLNDPVRLQLTYSHSRISSMHERADEINSIYGEDGKNFEGPFVVEEYKAGRDKPTFIIQADAIGPIRVGEEFILEEKIVGDPPDDYGEPDVWVEAEIVDTDHRYVYVKGSTNLMDGLILHGNIHSDADSNHGQNIYTYKAEVQKDGTFMMPIEYKSLTDEGFIEIYSMASLTHRRSRVILDAYGEEFEHLKGDIVEKRYEGKAEQMIKLTIPLNPEYEDAPDNMDVTKDGDEMKLIMPDDILFEFGESDIRNEGKSSIQAVAKWLEDKEYTGMIKIYGHTDNVGDDNINQPLSEERAENVFRTLKSFVNDPSLYQFEVKGFGEYEPISTNETDEGRQRNRRVEILLSGDMDTD
ncbi:OmpA family protein [Gracilibacillus xinjiangensis]|uniref:OmpA family protein n=1 Tax=Gracilibacillus xinjiangensis TaxID=1193282 RepID=A0ABV8WQL4_9BACI